jgi:large subunit ribosomal protein L28
MAKICAITGKGSKMAGKYSNRIRATKFNPSGMRRKQVNLQKKRIFVPELNKTVTVTVSTQGLRTITKNGAYKTLKKAGLID